MKLVGKIMRRLEKYCGKWRLQWLNVLLKRGKYDNNDTVARLQFDAEWESRIQKVILAGCNASIPRVANAGRIHNGFQTMHNGLEISTGDYYGLPIAKMLYLNKGVHEPEEEKIFQSILAKLPANPVMVEMGAYWSFYSMWFLKETTDGKVYMIEPETKNLAVGEKNFRKNNLTGTFDNYFVSSKSGPGKPPVISLDDYASAKGISHINIAHCDIQGFEMEMLQGAALLLAARRIDYFFISTHTNDLHYACIGQLERSGYEIAFQLDLDKVSSFDGLIVAISPAVADKHVLA
jgi:hypothetical protein